MLLIINNLPYISCSHPLFCFCIQASGLVLDLLVEIVLDVKLILRIKVLHQMFNTVVQLHFGAVDSGVRG